MTTARDGPRRALPQMSRRTPVLLGVALMLIAINLRPAITAVPPVLDDIRAALGLSSAASGLLTTLPLLCFALAAPLAPIAARRLGGELALLACLGLVAGGTAVRIMPELAPLFGGTLLLSVGIAVANVLLPSVIKRDFERPGLMMGLYVMLLSGGGGIGAGLSVPAEQALGNWRWALAIWGAAALVAGVVWAPAVLTARRSTEIERVPLRIPLLRDRTAWLLTGFFALQAGLFYVAVAWVPDILRDAGLSSASAGLMLALMALLGLPATMLVPVLAGRSADQRLIVVVLVMVWITGLLGLMLWPAAAPVLWMILMGSASGGAIALALTLIVLRAPDGDHAAALSGMAQGIGYLLAAGGPVLIGVVHDVVDGWTVPILVMIAGCLLLLAVGLPAGRPGMVGRAPDASRSGPPPTP